VTISPDSLPSVPPIPSVPSLPEVPSLPSVPSVPDQSIGGSGSVTIDGMTIGDTLAASGGTDGVTLSDDGSLPDGSMALDDSVGSDGSLMSDESLMIAVRCRTASAPCRAMTRSAQTRPTAR